MEKFYSFEQAFLKMLSDIQKHGGATSPRGRKAYELIGHGFILDNPRHRLIGIPERKVNIFYAIGNFLWVMSQSNELAFIEYYNPRGKNFSDDGKILRGAYGKRIFDFDGVNQFYQAINELKLDPDSRRAVVHIHLPQHDWTGSLDTPCTLDFQMFIRDGKLIMINHMRSQSAGFVMPYDVFLMTMIQEYVANLLGVEIGEYKHFCNNIHFFEPEYEIVNKMLSYNDELSEPMERMPNFNIKELLFFEKELREYAIADKIYGGDEFLQVDYWLKKVESFPKYWKEIGVLLILNALKYMKQTEDYEELQEAFVRTPYYKFL